MIIVLAILGLIVAIFVLSIRYFKSYARLKSHSNFESEAKLWWLYGFLGCQTPDKTEIKLFI